jgi:hypothetical protein
MYNNNNNNIDLYCINKQRVQSGLQALSLNQDNIQKDYYFKQGRKIINLHKLKT